MRTFILALLLAVGWISVRAADEVADPFQPAQFTNLLIENDDGHAITVIKLNGDTLIYQKLVDGKLADNATVHPSADDWFSFVQALNRAKVYKWATSYYYPGQGPGWSISLSTEDRTFRSTGTNEYPKEQAEDQPQADSTAGPSVPFKIFWQAALALVGKADAPAPTK